LKAIDEALFVEEIVPVEVPARKGQTIHVGEDEAPRRDTSLESLAKLKPAFGKEGTITAGNAPGVNDGACALVPMDADRAKQEGRGVLAAISSHAEVAVEPEIFLQTPGLVINEILEKSGKSLEEIDLFEINEAFAAVSLASGKIA